MNSHLSLFSYLNNNYVSECGRHFTTPEGTFSSPNFPGRYPHSRNCVWTIQVPRGRRVTLRFDNFNIESHSNCRYDYVDVSILFLGIFYAVFCGVKCSKQRKPLTGHGRDRIGGWIYKYLCNQCLSPLML